MMRQFEVWVLRGQRHLMTIDMTRHDFMLGFNRVVKVL